jgi:Kef-type K+ transport system membrane component KefB
MPMEIESGSGLLLITLGVMLGLGPPLRAVCHRLSIPVSVGYIALGLLAGSLLKSTGAMTSPVFSGAFSVLAQLGIVALLFRVGLRSHTSALLEKLPDASVVWIVNVLGTFATGYLVSHWALAWSVETSLVIATAFTATSIAVSFAVWDELGQADSDTAETLLDVAELDDLSAAVLLAILIGVLPAMLIGSNGLWLQAGESAVEVLVKLAAFIIGCYLFAHFLEAPFSRLNRRLSDSPTSTTLSILGVGLAIAAIAGHLGFSIAVGAFFAGLAFSRDPDAVHEDGGFSYLYDFLTPFFFIHIGMQTDLSVLLQASDVGLILFAGAAISKLLFTAAPALLSMSRTDAMTLGVSMIPRAEIALVVIYECRAIDSRIVPPEVFAGMVMVSLATSILAPIALRRILNAKSNARMPKK